MAATGYNTEMHGFNHSPRARETVRQHGILDRFVSMGSRNNERSACLSVFPSVCLSERHVGLTSVVVVDRHQSRHETPSPPRCRQVCGLALLSILTHAAVWPPSVAQHGNGSMLTSSDHRRRAAALYALPCVATVRRRCRASAVRDSTRILRRKLSGGAGEARVRAPGQR